MVHAGKRLPPGPPRLPIIGSLFTMPKDHQWLAYASLGREHGELCEFKASI